MNHELDKILKGKGELFEEEYLRWIDSGFKSPPPLPIKWSVIERWDATDFWIETGTLWGETALFLSSMGKKVITIEASDSLADRAKILFENTSSITVVHGRSEDELQKSIDLTTDHGVKGISFWLDGHYSGEGTFLGDLETPILRELEIITDNLQRFDLVTVLVDDIRLFNQGNTKHKDYPELHTLFDWAHRNNFFATIELDIFVATNSLQLMRNYSNG